MTDMTTEHEILQILSEECAEVVLAASKCIRFGYAVNSLELEREIGQVLCLIDIMHKHDMVSFGNLEKFIEEKYKKLEKYSNIV